MTTDARITEDLAVVGRSSRLRPIELEATLRAAGAIARPQQGDRSAMAVIYVARCGRVWAGAAAVVAIAGLLAHLYVPMDSWGNGLSALIWIPKLWVGAAALGFVLAAHVLGEWLATRKVMRGTIDEATLRMAALRARARAVTATIAGITTSVVFFGMMQVTLGSEVMSNLVAQFLGADNFLMRPDLRWPTMVTLIPALLAAVLGSIVVGRMASVRGLVVGIVMLAATIAIGVTFDSGPLSTKPHGPVSLPLRAVLTTTGTIGLFLTVAGIVFRIHRREDAVLAPPSS